MSLKSKQQGSQKSYTVQQIADMSPKDRGKIWEGLNEKVRKDVEALLAKRVAEAQAKVDAAKKKDGDGKTGDEGKEAESKPRKLEPKALRAPRGGTVMSPFASACTTLMERMLGLYKQTLDFKRGVFVFQSEVLACLYTQKDVGTERTKSLGPVTQEEVDIDIDCRWILDNMQVKQVDGVTTKGAWNDPKHMDGDDAPELYMDVYDFRASVFAAICDHADQLRTIKAAKNKKAEPKGKEKAAPAAA